MGLLNKQQITKTSVTCALCCTAQYNTLRDEPSLQTFLFRHFFTKIRNIFTVHHRTRKLSKIRKTYAKNVRLDRYVWGVYLPSGRYVKQTGCSEELKREPSILKLPNFAAFVHKKKLYYVQMMFNKYLLFFYYYFLTVEYGFDLDRLHGSINEINGLV